ncbi:hypothetical protein AWC38_SpisGene18968 [Stylophora pistillata]|uniref:Endonuclease/exonuclease/phosphatase domain-containing protein n=1 Tax=Stylophora pistillata TaxID=50429 RepID=A0A2B4RHU2_STYPI|nr:hypothetical protein AWC38_SpisGene18968 [Stylophora pistillata]
MLPSLCLLNARSLFPKLDELTALLATKPVDLVAITESWLRSDIDDSLLSMSAFNLFRKDRVAGRGGGICVYLNNVIPCKRRLDLENPNFECLWLTLRPRRLPRPLSGIAICVVYHPPGRPADSHKEQNDYLINTTDRLRNEHPDHGVVLLGDFNDFECSNLVTHHSLNPSVDDLASSFIIQLTDAIDRILPAKTIKLHRTDKPWITPELKLMIKDQQKAFHSGNIPTWRSLKYKVQQEITKRKKSFYKNKIQNLKKDDCRKWWNFINQMSGRSEKPSLISLERDGKIISKQELFKSLNRFDVSVNADIPPLDSNLLPAFLPAEAEAPFLQPHEGCKKLLAIKASKAHGPDNLPCRIVKEFAYELAEPITTILNTSLRSGTVPAAWKESNIIPIPKVHPPMDEGDTRPISLTLCLSKVLEDFVATWLIDDAKDKIDPNQFGCLKGTSTTYCLLDMIHTWLTYLDSPGGLLPVGLLAQLVERCTSIAEVSGSNPVQA